MDATKTETFWPKLRVDYQFEIQTEDAVLHLFENASSVYMNEPEYSIIRTASKRWRPRRGRLMSKVDLVKLMFDYQDQPTLDQIVFMEDFVDTLGESIDRMKAEVDRRVKEIVQQRENRRIAKLRSQIEINQSQIKSQNIFVDEAPDFVYLMRHVNGLTKIGASKNPRAREKTLQAEDPRLDLFFYCEANRDTERRLHEVFRELRVRGEWFQLNDRHIDWIVFLLGSKNKS